MEERPCEHIVRRKPSTSQKEGSGQELNLLIPWSWTSQPPEIRNECLLVKPPSQWYFAMAVQADHDFGLGHAICSGQQDYLLWSKQRLENHLPYPLCFCQHCKEHAADSIQWYSVRGEEAFGLIKQSWSSTTFHVLESGVVDRNEVRGKQLRDSLHHQIKNLHFNRESEEKSHSIIECLQWHWVRESRNYRLWK